MAVDSIDGYDELQLDEIIARGSLDFETWTRLISCVEELYHDDIDKISLVYDTFLSEFPLCYGYWKKYAEHKAHLCSVEYGVKIFERAVEAVPYSVGVWIDYCNFGVSSFVDSFDICRLFERGLSFVGKDYMCHNLWDKYIEFEFSQQHWNSLAKIYIQTLKFPTKKLHQYYESFKKLVAIWEEEMGSQGSSCKDMRSEHELDSEIMASEDAEISHVINDLLDPSTRSKGLQKYLSIGEQFYRRASDLDAKVQKFEQNIRRPYFHVKPLDDSQLQNWHQYLDLVEMEGDFDWAVKLYERCLISCANYPEFWMRYVNLAESKGGREIAADALARATHIFVKNAPEIHLFNAWLKEKSGDVDGAHEAFLQCDPYSESYFIDVASRKANMEKRLGNYVAASNIYKEAIDLAAEKRPDTIPMLYVHFARLQYMITNSVEASREVLLNGIQRVPHSALLLKELICFALMHDGASQVDIVDSVMAKALAPGSDVSGGLSTKDQEVISRLHLEFVDFCGSVHDVRRAWHRHFKLFPHLFRVQSALKKPANACILWRMATDGRPDSLETDPINLPGKHDANHLIQVPPQKVKLLVAENIDQTEPAGRAQSDYGNGILHNSELVPSKVPKTLEKDACKTRESRDGVVCQTADDRDPADVVKDSKSIGIQEVQEEEEEHEQEHFQHQKPHSLGGLSLNPRDDESQNVTESHSPGFKAPREVSLSNGSAPASGHDIDEVPSLSSPVSPRDNVSERHQSPCPSTLSRKNPLRAPSPCDPTDREVNWRRINPSGKGRSDVENSGERRERSLSPRRRSSHGHLDDRRHRERSLSPRRHSSRWHRERRNRRYPLYPENPRAQRDGRMQNQNHVVVVGNSLQTQNARQQTVGPASQMQFPVPPITYPQAQMNQYPLASNEQYRNVQNNPLYDQMWQYYCYSQQQLLLMQQQQLQPQQQMQNPLQQQHIHTTLEPQQIHPHQQQLQHPQYQQQQLYQQPQFQQLSQQQPNEQPQSQQQQLQPPQQMQLPQQQIYQQMPLLQLEQPQLGQIQQQQQPQLPQGELEQKQQQQQGYQYQQLQQQQYLLYLQQLHQYQLSKQQSGLVQDQKSLEQQQLPGKQEEEKLPELQNRENKSQPQQDDGLSQVDSRNSSHYQQDGGVEHGRTSTSRVGPLPQSEQELPEIEGTYI